MICQASDKTGTAELAGHTLVLAALDVRAELALAVAVVVAVAVSANLRDAVRGALVVDRVGVLVAELAGHALVPVAILCGAVLRVHVAVGVGVA